MIISVFELLMSFFFFLKSDFKIIPLLKRAIHLREKKIESETQIIKERKKS